MIDLIADLLSRSLLWVFAVTCVVAVVRYLVIAGGAWWLVWGGGVSRFVAAGPRPSAPDPKQVRREILYSLVSCLFFPAFAFLVVILAQFDLPLVYFYVADHGWSYLVFSIFLMVLLHDALFYWSHRLLHTRWLMRNVHFRHHQSIEPTPWAAFSFHPIEAFLQVLNIVIIVCLIPAHPFALSVFLILNVAGNVFGHCGLELMPGSFGDHGFWRRFNSPSLHGWHHRRGNKNFCLYFTFWDDLMATIERPKFPQDIGEQR